MNTDTFKHKETTNSILKSSLYAWPGTWGSINQLLEGPPASPEGEADGGQATNIGVGLLLNCGKTRIQKSCIW